MIPELASALLAAPGLGVAFGITVAVATLLVVGVGARLIRRRRSALLAPHTGLPMGDPVLLTSTNGAAW